MAAQAELGVAVELASGQRIPGEFEVEEATIAGIHQAVRDDRLTFVELTQAYLDRIERFDKTTGLNSIILVNPSALERAKEEDEAFRQTGQLAPLAGIPVVVKDNIHTKGLETTGGSVAMLGFVPEDDAFLVQRLVEAGAIVLCKTNLCEWGFHWGRSVSSVLGETRNPYDLERTPAGSSGGTAAAVAANFCTVGLGTDTGNSIRGPSSHTALVGLRSTMGATSRNGIIPLFERYDIGGPMCRTVEDTARVFSVISGVDRADHITEYGREHVMEDYTQFLDVQGLRGARVGVLRLLSDKDADMTDSEVRPLFQAAIEDLRRLGASIVDPLPVTDFWALAFDDTWPSPSLFAHDANKYLRTLGASAPHGTVHEIFAAGLCHPMSKEMFEDFYGCSSPEALRAPEERGYWDVHSDRRCCAFREAVVAAMDAHGVDALTFPTWNDPPMRVGETRGPIHGNNSGVLSPPTGLPALTVPMGYTGTEGVWPAGLQLVGRLFAEGTLLRLAYAYEQGTRHRQPPAAFVGSTPGRAIAPLLPACSLAAKSMPCAAL